MLLCASAAVVKEGMFSPLFKLQMIKKSNPSLHVIDKSM
ncbi:hypothetical protein NRI_0623 [Neorickettsia risticii str. Illinois]|uniref:Uncharacterized protein n=1 Tax=Neorickettsia risticii (strain Illinois) TaxID=434131 RepID=C6V5D2_NEORI|nr:hypothetical protein NRI_0623 [Neorickettsia risticii str. Illinois]